MKITAKVFFLVLLLLVGQAMAATTCASKDSGDWNNNNWTSACNTSGPPAGSNVVISNGDTIKVDSNTATVANVTINAGGTLRGNGGDTLSLTGDFTNNGTFTANGGTVALTGAAQTITGDVTFYNLSFGSSLLTLAGNVTVTNKVTGTINLASTCPADYTLTFPNGNVMHSCNSSTVNSINRASANPTTAGSVVAWTVVFSTSVTGVSTGNFGLAPTGGVTGAAITSVAGSGTTWTVNATTGTGTGAGTLGLNMVNVAGISPAVTTAMPFVGPVYTISGPFCSPPSNIPAGVTVSCQCDTFARASLNPSTIFSSNWLVSTSDSTGKLPSIVNPGYLRLTNNTGNNAKAATVPGIFPAAGNYISVEFQQYAYNGTGADGIAVTLSDYSVPAVPGAYGGSLGYAQETGIHDGFAGGWLGVGLDEYGNYQNTNEGRLGGLGFTVQSVGARGSGSGQTGYRWLGGTGSLIPNIDDRTSTSASRGYYYQVIVDARNDPTRTAVAVNRDTGSGYAPLISIGNIYTAATAQGFTQAPVPANWQISFTGSTGGSTNIHEIGGLRICASSMFPSGGGIASGFNAVDEAYGTPPGVAVQNYLSGHIYTKLVGTPFKLNVAALNNNQIQSAYVVSGTKSVTVKLVDNSDNACVIDSAQLNYCSTTCTSKVAVTGGSQPLSFASSNAGQKQSGDFMLNSAYKKLVAIISDSTTSACSTDSFSVRPLSVASLVSIETPAGIIPTNAATNVGTTSTPIFKAGSDHFALTATTTGVSGSPSGYYGVLKINNAVLQVASPATVPGAVTGTFPAATPGTPSSIATGTTFAYSEVGGFKLPGYAVTDTASRRGVYDGVATADECTAPGLTTAQCDSLKAASWTGVDSISTKGDCVADSYSNTKDVSGTISSNVNFGKFGCNFGLITTSPVFGRFVPNHLTLISAQTQQRSDIAGAYAATRETTGTMTAGSTTLTVADATGFAVGDKVVVFGAGASGRDLLASITIVASDVLTLSATATTGVTAAPVFKRLGFTYMDEPLRLTLSLEARNGFNNKTQNYATATGLAKLDNTNLSGTTTNAWALSGVVNNLYGVANCRAFFSGVNTTYTGSGCGSLPASAPAAPYAASATRVSPSNSSTVTWVAGAASLTTDITLKRANIPDGAFDFGNGTFSLGIWPRDGDGMTFLNANDGASLLNAAKSLDTDAVVGSDAVAVGVADMRLGRLRMQNRYGSERLPLAVPLQAQYWSITGNGAYFVNNADDSDTPVSVPAVRVPTGTAPDGAANLYFYAVTSKNLLLPADAVPTAQTMAGVVTSKIGGGQAKLQFAATINRGWLDIILQVPDYLRYNWGNCDGQSGTAGLFDDYPCARATFGSYKSPLIYRRENY